MSSESKEIRRIQDQTGTLTAGTGSIARVQFSLVQTQDFDGGVETLKRAYGTLEFENWQDASLMMNSPDKKLLRGGGIQAEVDVLSDDSFSVSGELKDI